MKKDTIEKLHRLLPLITAFKYHITKAEKIRKEIASIKLKDLKKN